MEAQPSNSVGPWYTSSSQEPPPAYSPQQTNAIRQPNRVQYAQQPRGTMGGGSCLAGKSCLSGLLGILSTILVIASLGIGLWQLSKYLMGQQNKTIENNTPILYPAVDGIYYNTTKGCDPSSRFQCPNGAGCIPYGWQCDGINDCYDNSDESKCGCKTSSEYYCNQGGCSNKYCSSNCPPRDGFQCKSNARCIPLKLRCDGTNDCGDLSDETGCTCLPTETACANGLCVKLTKWCDGFRDCRDGSDELAGCHTSCPNNGVRCQATGACMNQAQLCDRIIDCVGGADEISCPGCPTDQFKCSDGECVPNAWLCDGMKDCTSGEDETLSSCTRCQSSEFQCKYENYNCIPLNQRCDGTFHCADKSDEKTCAQFSGTGAGLNSLLVTQRGISSSFVCLENWNQAWSDLACREMGFKASKSMSGTPVTPGSKLLRTLPNTTPTTDRLVQYLEPTAACPSNQVVQLECEPWGCGMRAVPQSTVGKYIVNGAPAARGAWPWQVRILYDNNVLCGGSILNELWILTAAHCVADYKDFSKVEVRAGSLKFEGSDPDAQTRSVIRVFKHGSYDDNKQRNVLVHDVALLRLSSALSYTETVRPVCLPDKLLNLNELKLCVATGFGRTRSTESSSKVLLQGRMEPMSRDTCTRAFGDISNGEIWAADPSDFNYFVCAGSYPAPAGIDICQGDSGGPLACQDQEGFWNVIGVSSFGFAKCDLSVFAKVPAYSDWIKKTVQQYS